MSGQNLEYLAISGKKNMFWLNSTVTFIFSKDTVKSHIKAPDDLMESSSNVMC